MGVPGGDLLKRRTNWYLFQHLGQKFQNQQAYIPFKAKSVFVLK